jgi:MFS family permease
MRPLERTSIVAMGYSITGLSWAQDAYTLVFGGLLLVGARLGDILGRRRVFIAGLAVFALASFLVGTVLTGWWLIAAPGVQRIGAAIVAPFSLSLLTASFPGGREPTRAVAWYGAAAGIGASLGLVIGGALTSAVSWRDGLLINVPIGVAKIVLAPRYLPETERGTGRFDLVGALTARVGGGRAGHDALFAEDLLAQYVCMLALLKGCWGRGGVRLATADVG